MWYNSGVSITMPTMTHTHPTTTISPTLAATLGGERDPRRSQRAALRSLRQYRQALREMEALAAAGSIDNLTPRVQHSGIDPEGSTWAEWGQHRLEDDILVIMRWAGIIEERWAGRYFVWVRAYNLRERLDALRDRVIAYRKDEAEAEDALRWYQGRPPKE